MKIQGLNEASRLIHEDAKRKGFWDKEREIGTLLMLCVSELSEALEADRKGRFANLNQLDADMLEMNEYDNEHEFRKLAFEYNVKDSFEDELADTVIRILDLCGAKGIDIEKHIQLKLQYNRSREKMHCKAY